MLLKSVKNTIGRLPSQLRRLAFWHETPKTQVEQIHSHKHNTLSPEKQTDLERLCNELFKKKELITSGKLQLIGLDKIKKRMGKQWDGLSKIVYSTTEEVINKYLGKGDVFIRYKDDTYIIIFAHAESEESRLKSALIAEEIRRRLFELDEEELKDLEIRQAVSEIRTEMLMETNFPGEMFGMMDDAFDDWDNGLGIEDGKGSESPPEIAGIDVDTGQRRNEKPKKKQAVPVSFDCTYMPLLDTQRGALTVYVCLVKDPARPDSPLDSHKAFFKGKSPDEKAALDIGILEKIAKELAWMEQNNHKFLIACPVQHETLFNYDSYEEYKELISKIPLEHRKLLMLLVMNMESGVPPKKAYWFAKPMRTLCPYVMAEVPLRKDLNFRYIAESGINVAGIRLDGSLSEQETITTLNSFSSKVKSHKVPKTFILGVNSLSITTSAVCAGFDFLGGSAIHGAVEKPDTVHRYHYEDLIKGLSKQEK